MRRLCGILAVVVKAIRIGKVALSAGATPDCTRPLIHVAQQIKTAGGACATRKGVDCCALVVLYIATLGAPLIAPGIEQPLRSARRPLPLRLGWQTVLTFCNS